MSIETGPAGVESSATVSPSAGVSTAPAAARSPEGGVGGVRPRRARSSGDMLAVSSSAAFLCPSRPLMKRRLAYLLWLCAVRYHGCANRGESARAGGRKRIADHEEQVAYQLHS